MEGFVDISDDVAMTLGQQQLLIHRLHKRVEMLETELKEAQQALVELSPLMQGADTHVTHLRTVANDDGEQIPVSTGVPTDYDG